MSMCLVCKEPDYGRRLPIHVIDHIAATDPNRTYAFIPKTARPQDGWDGVSYRQFANAINLVAHRVADQVKVLPSAEPFPTVAYIGPQDLRYIIVMLACVRAGCKALTLSPRNHPQAQLQLISETKATNIWIGDASQLDTQVWIRDQSTLPVTVLPSLQQWLHTSLVDPYPYSRQYDEGRFDPLVVVHTSGSTGCPKPIIARQGSIAVADGFRNLVKLHGQPHAWFGRKSRMGARLLSMPLFHTAGIYTAIFGIYYESPVVLPPDRLVNAELIRECLRYSDTDSILLPPSIIEELSHSKQDISALKGLRSVAFAGGNLAQEAGDRLVKHGVRLMNAIGSSEASPYALHLQPDPALWNYFIINDKAMGTEWKSYDEEEGIYELCIRRKDPKDPLDQPVFYTFPELSEWETKDLYQKHPTLPNHWAYHGRADTIIVFSNGEKLNPVSMEAAVRNHDAVKDALVVGQGRLQPAIIIDPQVALTTQQEIEDLINQLWPIIKETNATTVAHGRIVRSMVSISDPSIPFSRTGKGTLQRAAITTAYKSHIDALYARLEGNCPNSETISLCFDDEATLTDTIVELIKAKTGLTALQPGSDFFIMGMDSLHILQLVQIIRSGAATAGITLRSSTWVSRVVYANANARDLARAFTSMAKNGGLKVQEDYEKQEIKAMEKLVTKYTQNFLLPTTTRPDPCAQNQTVLITGTTGSFGAYLLDTLCRSPRVSKIIALNRDNDGGFSRQGQSHEFRGLTTDLSKVEFLRADMSMADLDIVESRYNQLLTNVDRIIHNSWPVNFNMGVLSFEPHIRGVRNLVDFSSKTAKNVPIIFISSMSTVGGWNSANQIPEDGLEDLSLAKMGYGRSKLVGSLILDAVAAECGLATVSIRVGQIAGPRAVKGAWHKREYIPALVASSLHLGMLPYAAGPLQTVNWLPAEDMAALVTDVAGITSETAISNINGYFNAVNPARTTWDELLVAIHEYYGKRLRLVDPEEWLAALEDSAKDTEDVSRNPGIQLVDVYRHLLLSSSHAIKYGHPSMSKTICHSPALTQVGPITGVMMKSWCSQWKNYLK